MKLDILAIGAHPDDVELSCAGTLIKHIEKGYQVGILDLTKGELGTRGTPEIRMVEADNAMKIIGCVVRENLGFADGFFANDREHQLPIIRILRKYRPSIVIGNAPTDRHPDHGKACTLIRDACFLSGLQKIETESDGVKQEAWRPEALYHYIQAYHIEPDFVVDITGYMDKKMESVKAYSTQFHDPNSGEPETFISSPQFLELLMARAVHWGVPAGVKHAEGFLVNRAPTVNDLFDLI